MLYVIQNSVTKLYYSNRDNINWGEKSDATIFTSQREAILEVLVIERMIKPSDLILVELESSKPTSETEYFALDEAKVWPYGKTEHHLLVKAWELLSFTDPGMDIDVKTFVSLNHKLLDISAWVANEFLAGRAPSGELAYFHQRISELVIPDFMPDSSRDKCLEIKAIFYKLTNSDSIGVSCP